MDLTTHPHLVPGLKKKSRAIPLLPLWAFMACSRENFTVLPLPAYLKKNKIKIKSIIVGLHEKPWYKFNFGRHRQVT
jgi:hypothetical protein